MARAVVFAYHNVGVRCLSVLLAHGVELPLVVSHADSPGETIWFDSVAALAGRHGIPLITPADVNDPAVVAQIAALAPDFFFSFYYRQMLKAPLLGIPARGAWNMHGSLLPKYRGRVPVNWAVLHGERETGATLHEMTIKPDAGGILARQGVPILPDDTAFEVFGKVTVAAEMALDRVLPDLLAGRAGPVAQDLSAGSYFGGRKPEDGRIDWTRPAANVHNLVRAVAPPYPGAFCDTPRGRMVVGRSLHPDSRRSPHPAPALYAADGVLWAGCGDGRALRLLTVEFDGVAVDLTTPERLHAFFGTSVLPLP